MHTRLAVALVFPCSLFLKSQLAEEPELELSDGTVINLSCSKNKTQNQEYSRPYDIIHANKKPRYLTKASIYKSINKGGSKVLSSRITVAPALAWPSSKCAYKNARESSISQYDTNSTLLFLLPPFLIINALRIKTLSYKITNIVAQTIQ